MTEYEKGHNDGFKHGTNAAAILALLIIIIYLIMMKTRENIDPIQAYLNKQEAIQNYFGNSDKQDV